MTDVITTNNVTPLNRTAAILQGLQGHQQMRSMTSTNVMAIKLKHQHGWFCMNNNNIIPDEVFSQAEVMVDLSDDCILRGPTTHNALVSEYSTCSNYLQFKAQMLALVLVDRNTVISKLNENITSIQSA